MRARVCVCTYVKDALLVAMITGFRGAHRPARKCLRIQSFYSRRLRPTESLLYYNLAILVA